MSAGKRVSVGVVRLEHGAGLPLPEYQSSEAAGLDVVAALAADAPIKLAPGERVLVPTGLVLELPKGTEAQVRPRSGLAFKHGITVLNSPGTIDSDYRGEVKVLLINQGNAPFVIARGERIAQIVVATVTRIRLVEKKDAGKTRRGAGGFGSTGTATAKPKTKTKTKPRPNPKPAKAGGKPTAKRKSGARTRRS